MRDDAVKDSIRAAADIVQIVGQYVELKPDGSRRWMAKCPFHSDRSPSFKVNREKGVYHCFGCDASGDVFKFVQQIEGLSGFPEALRRVAEIAGVGDLLKESEPAKSAVEVPSKVTAVYRYTDEAGALLYEICRLEPGKGGRKKDFRQRYTSETGETIWQKHPRQVLYRLPAVLMADEVYVVEGEKDADTMCARGYVATTAAGGCKAPWLPEFTEALRGKRVVIIPDRDPEGLKRGEVVYAALKQACSELAVLMLPAGKDATEYFEQGGTDEEIGTIALQAFRDASEAALEEKGFLTAKEIAHIAPGGYGTIVDPSTMAKGIPSGFPDLDRMTLGFHGGELVILAARPAMGKTSLALNMAVNVAARSRLPVPILSLEMSRAILLQRMICAQARTDLLLFRSGALNTSQRRSVMEAFEFIDSIPVLIDDRADVTLERLEQDLTRIKQEHGGLGLVVLDYLQIFPIPRGQRNRNDEVGWLSRSLKLLARKLDAPFLVLSQLSRATEARTDQRPKLSDLRESGSIEQDADMVWFIYREEVYKKDRQDLKGVAELIIEKQRNGPTGKVDLTFIKHLTKFESMTRTMEN